MRLASFIKENSERILAEWDAFARTLHPAADSLDHTALRDHAKQILDAIAQDIEAPWQAQAGGDRSWGPIAPAEKVRKAAAKHGALRQANDFTMLQLSAEYRVLRASVLRLWRPLIDESGDEVASELIRFNDAIDQALAESITTFSARSEYTADLFLAILGHDLRGPLSTMALSAQLLAQPSLAREQLAEVSGRVRRSARLMTAIVEDLLGYTSTQLGRGMPVTLARANVETICRAAAEDTAATFPGSKFDFQVSGDPSGSYDAVRLHQLFTNLLFNAAQHDTGHSGVVVRIQAGADEVDVRITNFGPVIPEGALSEIFRPMVQLPLENGEEDRTRTSMGLGLFVAREIVTAHGGTISVKSSEADGTTFSVVLPRSRIRR
jgi:signal transduction histidine kinase